MTDFHRIGRGTLWHTRHRPCHHAFEYPTAMLLVDLDRLDCVFHRPWLRLNQFGLVSLKMARHLYCTSGSGGQAAREAVKQQHPDRDVSGRCLLLTNPHCVGIGFNPLSVYYLHTASDSPSAIILEVSNTPWNEIHRYVLPADAWINGGTLEFPKTFHVSPFNPMEQTYRLRMEWPVADQLMVYLALTDASAETPLFEAGLQLNLASYHGRSARPLFLGIWPQTFVVLGGIYREAFRLWRKHVPYHSHP